MSKTKPKKKEVKILIMGLTNSGKTSIVLSLEKDTNILSYFSLKPTKGIDRKIVEDENTRFHIWDFGGQEQYIAEYLQKLEEYFERTNKIIYVIDVQDDVKYDLSLEYLENILKALRKENSSVEFSIFLHKFDPNLEIDDKIVLDLTNRINELIPRELIYKFFKTTIYTTFRKTLL